MYRIGELGECGGTFTFPFGTITSPSYPGNYPSNADCVYTISQPAGTAIHISIAKMEIEYTPDYYENYNDYDYHQFDGNTCFDLLEIRDGNSQESALLGKYCGNSDVLSLPIAMQTTGEHLWLR